MKNPRKVSGKRAAAWSIMCAMAIPLTALGQAQVNQNGHARDANPQIGTGGLNGSSPLQNSSPGYGVVGNQLVSGNITAGREFQGKEPIPPAGALFTNTPLAGYPTDQFIKNSTGVPQPYQSAPPINTPQVFLPQSLGYTQPANFVQPVDLAGNYIQAPPATPAGANDTRLGIQPGEPMSLLAAPGTLYLPGPVDPSTNMHTQIIASSLTGIHQYDVNDPALANSYNTLQQQVVLSRLQLDQATIQSMQQELQQATTTPQTNNLNGVPQQEAPLQQASIRSQPTLQGGPQQTGISAQPMTATGTPSNAALSNAVVNNQLVQSQQLSTTIVPESQAEQYNPSPVAASQSQQLGRMQKLLADFYSNRKNAAKIAVDIHNQQVANANGAPAQPQQVRPSGPTTRPAGVVRPPAPLMVESLAKDVSAKGLHDVMNKAEDFLKAGKYESAVQTYTAAEEIAQGQPVITLVWMGRANAELGAGNYVEAERELRRAFLQSPELLMAKYDLHKFIGDDRLEAIVKDLKSIATDPRDVKNPTPIFLLAYISYNTGNERTAAAYLSMAEDRAGGNDVLFKVLRQHWTLPADEGKTPKP